MTALLLAAAGLGLQVFTNAVPRGTVELDLRLPETGSVSVTLATSDGGPARSHVTLTPANQVDESAFICYARRRALAPVTPRTVFTNAALRLDAPRGEPWFGFTYALLPWFDSSQGLYPHKEVEARMPEWRRLYPGLAERTFRLEFRHDPEGNRTLAYLDGQYAGAAATAGFPTRVEVRGARGEDVRFRARAPDDAPPRFHRLPPLLPRRAGAGVKSLALETEGLDPDVPLAAWAADDSIDTSRAVLTTLERDLFTYGVEQRHAFRSGPEYFEWSVPRKWWCAAWVLAAQTEEGTDEIGLALTRFGAGNRGLKATSSVSLRAAVADGSARKAGRVVSAAGKEVPLYLVRIPVDAGSIPEVIADEALWNPVKPGERVRLPRTMGNGDYLDFEFVGSGHFKGALGIRSGVRIFGCTLEEAPFGFGVVEHVPGNVFADGDSPVTALELVSNREATGGRVECVVRDELFRVVRRDERPFALRGKGARTRLDFDLAMEENGWYQLDFALKDESGRVVLRHRAACALLGRDDREAGFESPYAVWPQTGNWDPSPRSAWRGINGGFPAMGRHLTETDRTNVLSLIRKAGFHKGWHAPVRDEDEFPDLRFTFSGLSAYCGRGRACRTAADVSNRIEKAVADYREWFARFPHCETIQLFHEGGRGDRALAPELFGAEGRGAGRLSEGEMALSVLWATEYARRMRREFPQARIVFGNVGSTSEKVSIYARHGFDLNLVDALGSEVRGFRTIPELPTDIEAPGTLWALRETGRIFGMTNAAVDASSEYVFRPERRVESQARDPLFQTGNAVRDYLISLAFGVRTISSGHLQDVNSGYYDTDWGAAGLLTRHPFAYPKRMYVAIATLTKVMDKVGSPRRIGTGANAIYALEFERLRRHRDYAAAFWTAEYGAEATVRYPAGTRLEFVDAFGRARELANDPSGVKLRLSPVPCYVVSSARALDARVTPVKGAAWERARPILRITGETAAPGAACPVDVSSPAYRPGTFVNAFADTAEAGPHLVAEIDARVDCPALVTEYEYVAFRRPVRVNRRETPRIGLKVRGNGSFSRILLVFKGGKVVPLGRRGYVSFHGWQVMELDLNRPKAPLAIPEDDVKAWLAERHDELSGMIPADEELEIEGVFVGSARRAPDPLEMVPVADAIAIGDLVSVEGVSDSVDYDSAETEAMMETYLWDWL